MDYRLYRLDFYNGVRFGKGTLDRTDITFHADTLFSALYQEAMKLGKQNQFHDAVSAGRILFSDGFPYAGKIFYLPNPVRDGEYIPAELLPAAMESGEWEQSREDMVNLGKYQMKVSAAIRGQQEPQPYRVENFYFNEGNGLYIIVRFENEESRYLFEELLDNLQYTGLGGRKSSGLGRFEYMGCEVSDFFREHLEKRSDRNILLSTAFPRSDELELVLRSADYKLIRRSGFIDTKIPELQTLRKKDRYVFAPGSCFFMGTFKGRLIEEAEEFWNEYDEDYVTDSHPVYQYEKALFLGI